MSARLQPPEVPLRGLNIQSDLLLEQFRRIEFSFIANPLEELQTGGTGAARDLGVEGERFDRLAAFPERRPDPDIGDRVREVAGVQRDTRDIDATLRDEFILRFQVEGRDRKMPAAPGAFDDASFNLEPSSQQPASARHAPLLDVLADLSAADYGAARENRRNLDDIERVPPRAKRLDRSLLPVAESEVAPDAQNLCPEPFDEISADEGVRR